MAPRFFNVVAALCCLFVGTVIASGIPGATSSNTSSKSHVASVSRSSASQTASPAPTSETASQGPLPRHDSDSKSGWCIPEVAYHCYHELSMKFIIECWISAPRKSHNFALFFCHKPEEFRLHTRCKFLYSGCLESEKQQFLRHEQGYNFLHSMITNRDVRVSPVFLRHCVDVSVLRKCALKKPRAAQRLRDFRKETFALVERFSACVNKSVEKCVNATDAENLDIVKSVLTATRNLNWFDGDAEPEPTPPPVTTVKSTEAPSTTNYTEASTQVTTVNTTAQEHMSTSSATTVETFTATAQTTAATKAPPVSTSQSTEVPSTTKYTEASTQVTTVNTTPQEHTSTSSATSVETFTVTAQTPAATKAPHSSAPATNALGVLVLVALGLLKI
ncbi:uncharacterized protein [Dermacentor albipictus]|uniref:uncharacterized protein n=1 Tax=Dermacentor albipictus TaxID=60249 RepID=UPI0031FD7C90